MAHREFGHAGEDLSGKVDVRKVYDRLVALCGSEEAVKNVIAMYSEAFDMGYDAQTGTDALAMEVFTEIVCDSQADMNAFTPEDQADMAGFMREIKRIAQEEKAQIQGREPPDGKAYFSKSKNRHDGQDELEVPYGQEGKDETFSRFAERMHESARRIKQIGEVTYGITSS